MDDKEDAAARKTIELREKYHHFIEDVIKKSTTDKLQPQRDKLQKLRSVLFGEKRYAFDMCILPIRSQCPMRGF